MYIICLILHNDFSIFIFNIDYVSILTDVYKFF